MAFDLFLSCVTNEFQDSPSPFEDCRDRLAKKLREADCSVKVQEDFGQSELNTLQKLDRYIRDCRAVVHIVGEKSGSRPKPDDLLDLLEKLKAEGRTLLEDHPNIEIKNISELSYTQWEAYLALHHGIDLFVYHTKEGSETQSWHLENLKNARNPRHSFLVEDREDLNTSVLAHLRHILRDPELPKLSRRDSKARTKYLEDLDKDLTNRFKSSIHSARFIDLGVQDTPAATHLPWIYQDTQDNQEFHTITDAFDEHKGRLLILGTPGSGKTTTLLHIASQLLNEAKNDNTRPIPFIVNLSRFEPDSQSSEKSGLFKFPGKRKKQQKGDSFVDWIIQELSRRPGINRRIASRWLENGRIAFLFDGLDEVSDRFRGELAKILNETFFREYAFEKIVVCSRINEYAILEENDETRLQLDGAITLQPPTRSQVESYLRKAEATELANVLLSDKGMYELAETPLTLSMMTLAYGGMEKVEFPSNGSLADRRHHLMNTYVESMLQRKERRDRDIQFDRDPRKQVKESDYKYSPKKVRDYFGWLALRSSIRMVSSFSSKYLFDFVSRDLKSDKDKIVRQMRNLSFGSLTILFVLIAGLILGHGQPYGTVIAIAVTLLVGAALMFTDPFVFSEISESWTRPRLTGNRFKTPQKVKKKTLFFFILLLFGTGLLITWNYYTIVSLPFFGAFAILGQWLYDSFTIGEPFLNALIIGVAAATLVLTIWYFLNDDKGMGGMTIAYFVLISFVATLIYRLDISIPSDVTIPVIKLSLNEPFELITLTVILAATTIPAIIALLRTGPAASIATLVLSLGLMVIIWCLTWITCFLLGERIDWFDFYAYFVCTTIWIFVSSDDNEITRIIPFAAFIAGTVILGPFVGFLFFVIGSILGFILSVLEFRSTPLNRLLSAALYTPFLKLNLALRLGTPISHSRFLSYGSDALLLKRSGGEYEFIHRLVRDHFALLELLSNLDSEDRENIIEVIEKLAFQGESAIDVLVDFFHNGDPEVKTAATHALSKIHSPEVLKYLKAWASDPNPDSRYDVILATRNLSINHARQVLEKTPGSNGRNLAALLLNSPLEFYFRNKNDEAAVLKDSLKKLSENAKQVLKFDTLSDEQKAQFFREMASTEYVRIEDLPFRLKRKTTYTQLITSFLLTLDFSSIREYLVSLLDDEDPNIVKNAVYALSEMGEHDLLVAAYNRSDALVRRAVVEAKVKHNDFGFLKNALDDLDREIRLIAAQKLGSAGYAESVPVLLIASKNPIKRIRKQAAQGLRGLEKVDPRVDRLIRKFRKKGWL